LNIGTPASQNLRMCINFFTALNFLIAINFLMR